MASPRPNGEGGCSPPPACGSRLFARLAANAIPVLVCPLPDGPTVGSCEDEGLRYLDTGGCGNRLTFTTPADIRRLVGYDVTQWGRAVLAFLQTPPPAMRVVLCRC